MAVVQTGSVLNFNQTGANTGTVSSTITVPADAEMVIVGITGYVGTANYFSGGAMTFTKGSADTAMVAVQPTPRGDGSTSYFMAAMYYQVLPDTGANKTLKWDWLGSGTAGAFIVSVSFWKGMNTSGPVRGSGGAQGSGLPYTTGTITAQSGDLIVAWVGGFNSGPEGTIDSWSNLTLLTQIPFYADAAGDGAWATGSPSGNTTVAASTATNFGDGGMLAIALIPAAAGGASYTITGSIAVGNAVSGTMDYTRNAAIAGAIPVAVSPAAALDYTRNAAMSGSIPVTVAPASTLSYSRHYLISGDVSVGTAVASGLDYTRNASVAGSVAVGVVPTSTLAYNRNAALTGDVSISTAVSATLAYSSAGAYAIVGNVPVDVAVASGLLHSIHPALTGDVPIGTAIASGTAYNRNAAISGSVAVGTSVASALAYNRNASIAGGVTVGVLAEAVLEYTAAEQQITGAVTVELSVSSTLSYNRHAAFAGSVPVSLLVAAAMDHAALAWGHTRRNSFASATRPNSFVSATRSNTFGTPEHHHDV